MSFLALLWFWLAAFLLAVYAVMDGFDLGAGIVYGFTKDKSRKERILASISPIWSGNEVWLLAGVGSLLAAFTPVYGALLSSLYIPVILVLMALVFRACGVELRTKTESPALARILDLSIFAGSMLPAWGIGFVAGNVLVGMPLDAQGNVQGSWLFALNPYAIATGFLSLAAFGVHGLCYLGMKSEGKDREAFTGFAKTSIGILTCVTIACALAAVFILPARFESSGALTAFWIFAALAVIGYGGAFMDLRSGRSGGAFAASIIGLASLALMPACLLFPVLIPSRLGKQFDLTAASAASADPTLLVMLILAGIAVPLIAVYTVIAYRAFRGKVKVVRH